MRARQIIYRHYSDIYTKRLKKMMQRKKEQGDDFGMRILNTKLNRWIRAATSDIVTRLIMRSLKDKMKQHKKSCGRERLTLRDLNRLRKEQLAHTREEVDKLQNIEDMYGNN